ncbi:MerR family transcriptional regulator [Streptomyces sp. NPDC048604]|uniref:MerR family transcriptional regulator n=1 Tax=Streptomyces sp. NPDC048604 TaxID=3365578 RepID=UPI0037136C4A
MRIGELSRRTGVSVPTIKYYVREGLLPAGRLTSPNQASYDEGHERRLRLIRALLDVGGLSVAGIREVLAAIDDPEKPVHKVLGTAADRVVPQHEEERGEVPAAREQVSELIRRRGWRVDDRSPAAEALAVALAALDEVGHADFAEHQLDAYAQAAEEVATVDLQYVNLRVGRERLVEAVVVGTVLGDAVFGALRRLAHVDASARLFGEPSAESEGE